MASESRKNVSSLYRVVCVILVLVEAVTVVTLVSVTFDYWDLQTSNAKLQDRVQELSNDTAAILGLYDRIGELETMNDRLQYRLERLEDEGLYYELWMKANESLSIYQISPHSNMQPVVFQGDYSTVVEWGTAHVWGQLHLEDD
jgi:hypothetical protein